MAIEADDLVDNIGDWTSHRDEVRQLAFELTKAILQAYLPSGHDVILPYLVIRAEEAQEFESIARNCNAEYYEIILHNERADAIARLLKRGKWGQATSPPLTDEDVPHIEELFTKMETALEKRPNTIKINLEGQDSDTTYSQLLHQLEP